MSILDGKVRLYWKAHRNALVIGTLVCIQFVLTVILSVSLAAHIIWPEGTRAATPAPLVIPYEGRLTDASGNALGGTGTPYCYRFSIYDSAYNGSKLWPGGTPTAITATTTDGIFNTTVGVADALSSGNFDFSTTSTAFLQVEVYTVAPVAGTCSGGSWETLQPREQILASAYSLASNDLGKSITADLANSRVLVGSGTGLNNTVYLGLDWKNTADYVGQTCSTNGFMWYNSSTNQALICSNGKINAMNDAGTTTLAAVNANAGTPTTGGTIVFQNSNMGFGINGNTITASVSGRASVNPFDWPPGQGSLFTAAMASNGAVSIVPFHLDRLLSVTKAYVLATFSGATTTQASRSAQHTISLGIGIYTLNANTLNTVSTGSTAYTYTYNSNNSTAVLNGLWKMSIPITINASPGNYWYAIWANTATASTLAMSLSFFGGYPLSTNVYSGDFGVASNVTAQIMPGFGLYTSSTNAIPATISLGSIVSAGTATNLKVPYVIFTNY